MLVYRPRVLNTPFDNDYLPIDQTDRCENRFARSKRRLREKLDKNNTLHRSRPSERISIATPVNDNLIYELDRSREKSVRQRVLI